MRKETEYFKKLQDPRWQKKRLDILTRDGWECQSCHDNEVTLHVHHRYYKYRVALWDYPDNALITLCASCHNYERENLDNVCAAFLLHIKTLFLSQDIERLQRGLSKMKLQHAPEVIASAYELAFSSPELQTIILDYMHTDTKKRAKRRI